MSRQQSSTSTAAKATASSSSIQVYAPGFRHVLTVPMDAVAHMPPSTMHVTRYVLCANFDAAAPHTSCPMGDRCKFVHADTRRAIRQHIHVNYAWRSLSDVSYDRFEAGEQLHVAAPNSKVPTDLMDSDMVLKTKALQSKRRPLSHCAHYYFNRTCNLGSDCQFIHAVFIDPNAKDHQRAPVPSQLGEGRELQLSKKQREARQRDARDHIHDHDDDHHHHHDEEVAATAAPQHQHQRTYGAAAAAPAAQPVRPFVHHAMPTFVRQQAAAQTPSSMYGAEHHRTLAPFGAAVVFEDSSAQFPLALSSASSDAHHTPRGHDSCSDDDHHVCPTAFGKDAASPDLAATKSAAGAFRAPSSCGSFGSSNGIKAASGPRFRHDPYSLSAPRVVSLRSTLRTIA